MSDTPTSGTKPLSWFQARAQRIASHPVRMRTVNVCALLVSVALAVGALAFMGMILDSNAQVDAKNDAYTLCDQAVQDLQDASNYLTGQSQAYVNTGTRTHLDNYIAELTVRDRRGNALTTLKAYAGDSAAVAALERAVEESNTLSETELYAMRLVAEANGLDDAPAPITEVVLSHEDEGLSALQMRARAHTLMTESDYSTQKLLIGEQVQECSSILLTNIQHELETSRERLGTLMSGMRVCVIALLFMVAFVICSNSLLLLIPMASHAKQIRADEPLSPSGARELRYLTDAYNDMYDKNHARTTRLRKKAEIDPLTGVFNRGVYEGLIEKHHQDMALMLVDVDNFKHFNDEYGHDMGDAVLTEVAATLFGAFRSSDHVCRIGGDEFAVIVPGTDASMRGILEEKVAGIAAFLRDDSNGIPPVTVSIGVAFSDGELLSCDDLFRAADEALYATKRAGRDGVTFAPVAE